MGGAQSQGDPREGCHKLEPRKSSSCPWDTTASLLRRLWHVQSRAGASLEVENKQVSSPKPKQKTGPGIQGLLEGEERAWRTYIRLGRWQGTIHLLPPVQALLPEQRWDSQGLTIPQPRWGRIQSDRWEQAKGSPTRQASPFPSERCCYRQRLEFAKHRAVTMGWGFLPRPRSSLGKDG